MFAKKISTWLGKNNGRIILRCKMQKKKNTNQSWISPIGIDNGEREGLFFQVYAMKFVFSLAFTLMNFLPSFVRFIVSLNNTGQPDNSVGQDCAVLNTNEQWNHFNCSMRKHFICEQTSQYHSIFLNQIRHSWPYSSSVETVSLGYCFCGSSCACLSLHLDQK